jgi:transposase
VPLTTCYNWKAGVWDRIMAAVSQAHDGGVHMVDSTSVRAHQHAATSKKPPGSLYGALARGADVTTEIHAILTRGLPRELALTPGQAGDCPVTANLLGHQREGAVVLADKAYDADWPRRLMSQ